MSKNSRDRIYSETLNIKSEHDNNLIDEKLSTKVVETIYRSNTDRNASESKKCASVSQYSSPYRDIVSSYNDL